MPRTRITEAHYQKAYYNVSNEDGCYEAHRGYNVFVNWVDEDNCRHEAVYVGRREHANSEDYAPCVVFTEDDAESFVDYINSVGSVDIDGWWYWFSSMRCDGMPDYVINPHRPEYN